MTCACSSGRFASDGACSICTKGMVCLGGNAPPSSCPIGLATVMTGARSFEQCLTTAGFGRIVNKTAAGQLLVQAQPCQAGSYNAGGNSSPCQRCGSGLTTAGEGAKSARDCGVQLLNGAENVTDCPVGSYKEGWNLNPCISCGEGLLTESTGAQQRELCRPTNVGWKPDGLCRALGGCPSLAAKAASLLGDQQGPPAAPVPPALRASPHRSLQQRALTTATSAALAMAALSASHAAMEHTPLAAQQTLAGIAEQAKQAPVAPIPACSVW
ncbi:hypothetical protein OEZ86_004102 [Tetradesmus obliquus]|nr:hypothetical protein OEZ86_004102 [Tetradesmus obliquus]